MILIIAQDEADASNRIVGSGNSRTADLKSNPHHTWKQCETILAASLHSDFILKIHLTQKPANSDL